MNMKIKQTTGLEALLRIAHEGTEADQYVVIGEGVPADRMELLVSMVQQTAEDGTNLFFGFPKDAKIRILELFDVPKDDEEL